MTTEIDISLPTIAEIDQELVTLINARVVYHLGQILRHIADEYQINFEKLKESYLDQITAVADEVLSLRKT
jgi:hypothetical protein